MRFPAVALASIEVLLLASACSNDPCAAPERCVYATLLLTVHDAAGNPLPAATVSQNGVPLGTEFTASTCAASYCTHAVLPAAGPVTVSLQGYQDAVVDYVPAPGACGAPMRLGVDVTLRPTTDATPTEILGFRLLGSGCGP
jgi:hypothetical protein